jgi:hypothetical protein
MSASFLIPVALIMLIASLFAGAADQAVDANGNSVLGQESNVSAVFEMRVLEIQEISPLGISISVPRPNFSFFAGIFDILTWDYSYFDAGSQWSIMRFPLLALTFAVGIMLFISAAPVLVSLTELAIRTAAGGIGLLFTNLRMLFPR